MPGKMVTIPAELLQRFVGFIEKSGALLERVQQDGEQAKQAAPAAAETLVKQGLIDESQKSAAVESLGSNHVKALETLRRTATHVAPTSMGAGEEKSASDGTGPLDEANARFNKAMGF
jgi:hypothetical protein